MSNLGLLQAMKREGVRIAQTGVGDRYVLEEMRAKGYCLGGEQSGHVIMLDHATTGDGVLTGSERRRARRRERPVPGRAGPGHDPAAAGLDQRERR